MKKLIIATSIALALTAGTTNFAFAEANEPANSQSVPQEKKNEMIGFGSGAIAGAAIGGPVGSVIGGIFGLLIADDVNRDDTLAKTKLEVSQLNHELNQNQNRLTSLQNDYKNLQQQQMLQLVAYEEQDNKSWLNDFSHFETNLQFKTASYLIEDTYMAQLNSLAALLSSYPELSVNVTGYADHRGDSQYNHALSLQRADAVKTYLLKNKVKNSQISVIGAGESKLVNSDTTSHSSSLLSTGENAASQEATIAHQNPEDLFFERRVNITLLNTSKHLTAAN